MANDYGKRSAIIQSKAYSVRAVLDGDETKYAAMDIVAACGIGFPTRWLSNFRKRNPELLNEKKMPIWIMTEKGPRVIRMVFIDAESVKTILGNTQSSKDAKKWILEEVLTYRISVPKEKAPKETGTPEEADAVAENTVRTDESSCNTLEAWNGPELNRRIDNVLFELLEIKKQVAMAAYRA